ncbi:MAG: NUDIX hydrolase [Saprospiraceae bacterium]|nr:NUDIX hydrolase [Saprospiraceae bacterium]
MNQNPWITLSIKEIYENRWLRITHREVINPSGNPGIYGVVHFKNTAIGVVPLDEALNTWLVGQFRYALNKYTWEIPEGGAPLDTSPLEAAQRELLEETGITAQRWTKILDVHTSNSVTDEYGMAFVAQDLSFGEAMPEETEQLQVRKLPFAEALEMVMNGEITDSLSMVAIMKVKFLLDAGNLSF